MTFQTETKLDELSVIINSLHSPARNETELYSSFIQVPALMRWASPLSSSTNVMCSRFLFRE